MGATRNLAAILVADVVGYSRLAGAGEERTLARLRGLPSDLIELLASGIWGPRARRNHHLGMAGDRRLDAWPARRREPLDLGMVIVIVALSARNLVQSVKSAVAGG
jgi:hypothetical protein